VKVDRTERVNAARRQAAAELTELRVRVESEVGGAVRWSRWSRPLAGALAGFVVAWGVRRGVRRGYAQLRDRNAQQLGRDERG